MRPIPVPDTESYHVLARKETVEGALTHYRTYGYPLLIRVFGRSELPGRELWIYFFGVICFFGGVAAYTGSGWLAVAAASPLVYAEALRAPRQAPARFRLLRFRSAGGRSSADSDLATAQRAAVALC